MYRALGMIRTSDPQIRRLLPDCENRSHNRHWEQPISLDETSLS